MGPIVVVSSVAATLGEILPRLGDGANDALREGRVFIGARRAMSKADGVAAGDEVTLYAGRSPGAEVMRILLRRDGIVAAYKPAPMATVADHHGSAGTLENAVAELLGLSADVVTVTSRLDVGVSGVVLLATDDTARAKLAHARETGRYRRHYLAIASRAPTPDAGLWTTPIGRDRDSRKRRVGGRDARPASTRYALCDTTERAALLAVEPVTGRTHQIRVHAAHAGCPLYGDGSYGGPTRIVSGRGSVTRLGRIALHAAWVEIADEGGALLRVDAEVPPDLSDIWTSCGGAASAWSRALDPIDPPEQC